ncbi:cytochrome b/b6 domain-containing protein [Mesorhizobium sp. BAC0120]|uniref:cytochrome b/b6 domain-containing protein n=1 Tax=Mesorhizobium sp. BAC0120 TaxID=3090670 RepID=UPI00298C3668|nr:cytochrome b/b6 domain-containing protein [Mesorhizobium sp. BAC0120]MDW6022747.1 cytochrome b/b6 domain-containing protein [Mesorhizobium sp. BAC0120]
MDARSAEAAPDTGASCGTLVYRQYAWTRITHWIWAVSLFFLLLSGLQIFNAHPALYIGDQSGFQFQNHVLAIGAENTNAGPRGYTDILGRKFDTSGVLGMSGPAEQPNYVAFPRWATIPSYYDLATGRVIHFFFAWILVGTLLVWLVASAINGHLRELVPTVADIRRLPRDIANHARLRFHHMRDYNTLQKLTYAIVLFIFFPLMILTGLSMSPSADALLPFLPEAFGGRQTARTIHFTVMALLVLFFVVHIVMVLAAGPINELRSIVTGWYRTDPSSDRAAEEPRA